MSEAVIEAIEIARTLGSGAARVHALKGVSVSIKAGELALLMGPSGSGKTTLLSILGCMLTPTSGTVRIAGKQSSARARRNWQVSGVTMWVLFSNPIIYFRR